jgi:hypothetical protein
MEEALEMGNLKIPHLWVRVCGGARGGLFAGRGAKNVE